ncbi:MAG: alkaline phosphatase family protein, partial [Cyanobacteria bacterium]|nr:alkaline phosphatase family protein [Cyanobacteriota bacterium]
MPVRAASLNRDIRLVLQITIDQLRGDLPLRFENRFGSGGFRLLMDRGAVYTNANYKHADTETAPGHATLVTGGTPVQHG